jgi:hypothetical protein
MGFVDLRAIPNEKVTDKVNRSIEVDTLTLKTSMHQRDDALLHRVHADDRPKLDSTAARIIT